MLVETRQAQDCILNGFLYITALICRFCKVSSFAIRHTFCFHDRRGSHACRYIFTVTNRVPHLPGILLWTSYRRSITPDRRNRDHRRSNCSILRVLTCSSKAQHLASRRMPARTSQRASTLRLTPRDQAFPHTNSSTPLRHLHLDKLQRALASFSISRVPILP